MRRSFAILLFLSFLSVGLLGLAVAAGSANASNASTAARVGSGNLPAAVCDFTSLNFNLTGSGTAAATRAFTPTVGDTFMQFTPLPPITATASSQGVVMVNEAHTGALSGGLTGTFVISDFNGVRITDPEGSGLPRGFMLSNIRLTSPTGVITAVLGLNFVSVTPQSPNNRTIAGFIHSTATSGSFASYRYEGVVTGGIATQSGNALLINAAVTGRLYSGAGTMNELVLATRSQPANRGTTFEPGDTITQFGGPDLVVPATAPGHISSRSTFTGTAAGTINGGFLMDHNVLQIDGGTYSGRGWLFGNFNFIDTNGDVLTGPWFSDQNGNQLRGIIFQSVGTGVYSDSVLFGNLNGTLINGTNLIGELSGIYCEASQISTATPTNTPPATSTSAATPVSSSTPAGTLPPATPSNTPVLPTSTAAASVTPQGTATATSEVTASATSGTTATSTPPAGTPIPTATACTITFTDVPPNHTFYPFVRCLACRGIINGYPDGTFKPDNWVTRGQLSKIVSQSAGFTEPVSGQTFEDVLPGSTFYEYIERLASRQVMGGYQCGIDPAEPCVGPENRPYFRPNAGATRGQLTKIVSNAAGFNDTIPDTQYQFTDVEPGSTFWLYVERLLLNRPGVMSGYTCGSPGEPCDSENRPYFRPNNPLTRGQTSKIVANTFFPGCNPPRR